MILLPVEMNYYNYKLASYSHNTKKKIPPLKRFLKEESMEVFYCEQETKDHNGTITKRYQHNRFSKQVVNFWSKHCSNHYAQPKRNGTLHQICECPIVLFKIFSAIINCNIREEKEYITLDLLCTPTENNWRKTS